MIAEDDREDQSQNFAAKVVGLDGHSVTQDE